MAPRALVAWSAPRSLGRLDARGLGWLAPKGLGWLLGALVGSREPWLAPMGLGRLPGAVVTHQWLVGS